MREIILDTETTGLDPKDGHRVIEIGALELTNMIPGANFHAYFNPERSMPSEAENIHGLSDSFLADKPLFKEQAQAFLDFIGDSPLVAHNADFDINFLNAEFARIGHPGISNNKIIDTVALARKKFPGAKASLDALCQRFSIDTSDRSKHGALLDAGLLAQVYIELRGGLQKDLGLDQDKGSDTIDDNSIAERIYRPVRAHAATQEELERHARFVDKIPDAIWKDYTDRVS